LHDAVSQKRPEKRQQNGFAGEKNGTRRPPALKNEKQRPGPLRPGTVEPARWDKRERNKIKFGGKKKKRTGGDHTTTGEGLKPERESGKKEARQYFGWNGRPRKGRDWEKNGGGKKKKTGVTAWCQLERGGEGK